MTADNDTTSDPYPEKEQLELKPGTLARIDAVLRPGETRKDYVRAVVEEALLRYEQHHRL